jgi:hypothetical protein
MPVPALPGFSASGPCDWIIDPVCGAEYWATLSPALQTAATDYAVWTLWASTGRRYGVCEQLVRPCVAQCCGPDLWGWSWYEGEWYPYIHNGEWFNCGCLDLCTCSATNEIRLPGPVAGITEILVDGVVLAPGNYRVDNGNILIRLDGEPWPAQDLDVDSGVGYFLVTYDRGIVVPAPLSVAAGTLAIEFAKACQGQDCRLPGRATNISRSGVQITLQNVDQLLENGFTGIDEVDTIIRALNPHRLTHRMRVYTPDLETPRTRTL